MKLGKLSSNNGDSHDGHDHSEPDHSEEDHSGHDHSNHVAKRSVQEPESAVRQVFKHFFPVVVFFFCSWIQFLLY